MYIYISMYIQVNICINTHTHLLVDIQTYIYIDDIFVAVFYTALIPTYTLNNHVIIAICMYMLYP